MNKQIKETSSDQTFLSVPSFQRKILPLKHRFITLQSRYDYGNDHGTQVLQILKNNPKWCHLSLKLGHRGESKEYVSLRQVRSLRLRSIHLESYALDSQGEGDNINWYYGELDTLTRAGHTLKKLSLSVATDGCDFLYEHRRRLKKFVKKQKNLDEFGLYLGDQGDPEWMSQLLIYMQKTVKTLTIENMVIDDLFKECEFPKLETLRLESIMWFLNEKFDLSVLRRSLKDILALPSLKALVFSQYQRYPLETYKGIEEAEEEEEEEDEEEEEEEEDEDDELSGEQTKGEVDIPSQFWEKLRAELAKHPHKSLKIKYHMKEDLKIEEKVENFKRIFEGLPKCQTFEYEVAQISQLSDEEVKAQRLQTKPEVGLASHSIREHWKGVRYLISLDQIETIHEIA